MVGWRKFALFVGVEAVMTWAWQGGWSGIDGNLWVSATQIFFGLFIIGNGIEHSPKISEAIGKLTGKKS